MSSSERFGARTVRLCYPAVATTALGAIPGGLLMYGLSAEILLEQAEGRLTVASRGMLCTRALNG